MSYNADMRYEIRNHEDLGRAIAEFRALQGLTQTDLAKRAGLNRTYLSNIEHGEVPAFVERYVALLNTLGLKLTISDS